MTNLRPIEDLNLRCASCPVRHHAVCHALEGSNLHELSDIMMHRHLKAGDSIIHQDEASQLFAIIVSGVVKLTRLLPDGRQQIVGLLTEADLLGNLFSADSHDEAECVTDVELCCFRRTQFERVLEDFPEVGHRLLQKSLKDVDDARQWLTALGRKSAIEKVATFLLWLRGNGDHHCPYVREVDGHEVVEFPFSRQEIANFLGLTLETVSRTLSKLNTSGTIRLIESNRIELTDVDRLDDIASPTG